MNRYTIFETEKHDKLGRLLWLCCPDREKGRYAGALGGKGSQTVLDGAQALAVTNGKLLHQGVRPVLFPSSQQDRR